MKTIFLLLAVALLSGCVSAGRAAYRLEPVLLEDGKVGYAIDVVNTKNIGKLHLVASRGADGALSIDLEQDGVDASGPMGVMAESNAKLIDSILNATPVP